MCRYLSHLTQKILRIVRLYERMAYVIAHSGYFVVQVRKKNLNMRYN